MEQLNQLIYAPLITRDITLALLTSAKRVRKL